AGMVGFTEAQLKDAVTGGHGTNVYGSALPELRALLRLLDDLPEGFWPTGDSEPPFLVAWEEIRSQVIRWETHGTGIGAMSAGTSGNAVYRLHSALLKAPSAFVPDDVPGLDFVLDSDFRARLRDFRNLIHPGKEQRTMSLCTKGTALQGLAALHLTIADRERHSGDLKKSKAGC